MNEELREVRVRGGNSSYNNHKGIFALTDEERRAARVKGGRNGGLASLNGKKGIHGLTKKRLSKAGLVGGHVSTLKRGQVPWVKRQFHEDRSDLAKIEFAHNMTFIHGTNYDTIAHKLNRAYHDEENVRHYSSVKAALWKFRKGLIKNL